MGNPFNKMKAIIAAEKQALQHERNVQYRVTGSSLDSIFGNLSTTYRGISRRLTNQNARQFAAIQQLATRTSAKNDRTIQAAQDYSAGIGGPGARRSVAPARGVARSSRINAQGAVGAGMMVGRAGQASLAIGKQTIGAARQGANFELNQALAYRTQQDTAQIAAQKLALQQQELQQQLDLQKMRVAGRIQHREDLFTANLQETLAERQMKLQESLNEQMAGVQEGLNEQQAGYQQGLDLAKMNFGSVLDSSQIALQEQLKEQYAATQQGVAYYQSASDSILSEAASGKANRAQALGLLGQYATQYNLSPEQIAGLQSQIDSAYPNPNPGSYSTLATPTLPQNIQADIYNTVSDAVQSGEGLNGALNTIATNVIGKDFAKGVSPAQQWQINSYAEHLFNRLSNPNGTPSPSGGSNFMDTIGKAMATAAAIGGASAIGATTINGLANAARNKFGSSSNPDAEALQKYAKSQPAEIPRPEGGAMGRTTGGAVTEINPETVDAAVARLNAAGVDTAGAATEFFGGAGAAAEGAGGIPMPGVGVPSAVKVGGVKEVGLLPKDHSGPQDEANLQVMLNWMIQSVPSDKRDEWYAKLEKQPDMKWMVAALKSAFSKQGELQMYQLGPDGNFYMRVQG